MLSKNILGPTGMIAEPKGSCLLAPGVKSGKSIWMNQITLKSVI